MEGISNEAVNEVARNLFDGGDIDYTINRYGSAEIDTWNLPDVDNYEYSYGTVAKETLDKAIELLTKLISSVKFYVGDNGAHLELNDNHTLWDINAPDEYEGEFDNEHYQYLVDQALDEFEERTGVKAYQDGRMGRHIVVDITFDNMTRFDELKEVQESLEADVIKRAEDECFPATEDMTESLNKGEKKARCLSCGVDVIYTNRDVCHDIDGDYIECPNCNATFDVDYDTITPHNRSVKTESLRQDTVDAIELAINEIDNGFSDDPDWSAERYPTYNSLVQGVLDLIGVNIKYGSGVEKEPTSAINFSGKEAIINEIKSQLANWGYTEDYFADKKIKTESYEVWQKYYEDGEIARPEYVQSFDTFEKAQKFADGLNEDPDCEAWVKDLKESKKVTENDNSTFTPVNKVLSGNKGLSEKQIDEMENSLPQQFKDMTNDQKQISEELSLRGMVMSCLAYGEDIHSSINRVSVGKYRGKPYVDEYYDILGKDVTEEIIRQQELYFENCEMEYNVGEDSEGVTYNSIKEPETNDYPEPTYKEIKLNSVDDLNTIKEGDKVKLKFRYKGKYGRIGKISWWHPYVLFNENGEQYFGGVQYEVEFEDGSKSSVFDIEAVNDRFPELVTKGLNSITKIVEETKKVTEAEDMSKVKDGVIRENLNTGVLRIIDVDMYSIDDEIPESATQEGLDEIIQDIAPKYLKEVIQEVLPSVEIYATGVYHPRQYNFSGDELEFDLVANKEEYEALKEKVTSDENFNAYLRNNYKSYDGFISYMADDISEFGTQDTWKQVVQVIMFALGDEDNFKQVKYEYLEEFLDRVHTEFGWDDIEDEDLYESKKVELFNNTLDVNINANDISSNNTLDLGGLGDLMGMTEAKIIEAKNKEVNN